MAARQVFCRLQPKVNNYHNDGTGRDSYISKFNGGQMNQTLQSQIAPQRKSSTSRKCITSQNQIRNLGRSGNLPPSNTHQNYEVLGGWKWERLFCNSK
ncbi:unnamed protein product (macronuclear) [Paramecium tetraurelia]|uniref:Uncharacterized protein n=1 Tax=Paramecium tetraurelia TaxID=5888 RepID=A0CS55_PARTE|nr:uncharacterized protein GSPATT00009894001 [Paramecium tetraurelia]CAK73622.1 unnamed protein product [Paramecium tetraurelia]|eukprot:XP_001441019.1 hypothetical protein (macronuclear) [Paramecium tetraurelia strain d4-2]